MCSPSVIVPGLDPGTGLVGRPHVVEMICASEFEGSHVLGGPARFIQLSFDVPQNDFGHITDALAVRLHGLVKPIRD